MKSDKELFDLAKMYVVLSNELERRLSPEYELEEIKESLEEIRNTLFELEEIKESLEEIRNTLLEKNYDVNKFLHFQQLYKEMSIKEYYEFIKTLE